MTNRLSSILALLLLFISFLVVAQNENRQFNAANFNNNKLSIEVSDGTIVITPYSDSNLEVLFLADTIPPFPANAIIDKPYDGKVTFNDADEQIRLSTGKLSVVIDKQPFKISYFHIDKYLFSEEEGYFANDSISGFRFNINKTEHLFGAGERALGMNRRGHRLQLYNRASYGYQTYAELMYYSMPLLISSEKYMLGFDNGASGWLDLGKTEPDILQFECVGGRKSYFVVTSDSWPGLMSNFTELTGRQPLLPRWALGNISSRMGYHSQQEVESIIDKYAQDNIPLDGIVLDLYWFGPDVQGHMGNLEWDRDSFPEPELMLQRNKEKGIKTVLITEPFILKSSGKYKECAEQGLLGTSDDGEPYIFDFFFGTTALLDIFKPEARDWFWNIYKKHTLSGVDGWWGDLGEPEVHPDDLLHVNGRADEVHNLYGHEWAKVIYKGFKKDFPERRPVTLMRAGFIGSQRYGMIPWSGDVSRSWGGLQSQVEISLQMGMQGLAYMHSDLGGFAGNYRDDELYTRWLQYGVFQPVYRTHAQEDVPPEPVFWPDSTKNIVRYFINLRYQLLPYNYTLMHENSTTGMPMMRPLFFYDNKPELLDYTDAYTWGESFLVSPVIEKGIKKQSVYLPAGYIWYDFFNGKRYEGGQTIEASVDMETIPVFVRAGSFIPMIPLIQNTEAYSSEKLILHYYHDDTVLHGNGYLYDDDGKSRKDQLSSHSETLTFNCINDGKLTFRLTPEQDQYEGMPEEREIELVVHNFKRSTKHISIGEARYKIANSTTRFKKLDEGAAYCKETGVLHVKFKLGNTAKTIIAE
ncbi:TIM-barrel domain-containing protein [Carboxylicivirga sp. RSCT41]|uniref:glycoside hydrolase family 31 protein n=1 Tax=Carboxylicivirga agarovorans TaxID=3417570 RepID=UPI003D324FEF